MSALSALRALSDFACADCAAEEHPSEPSAELEQSVREPVSQSAGAQGELAVPQAEPAVAQADLAVAQAEPAIAQAEPHAAIAQPVSKTSSQGEQQDEITSLTGRQDMTANDVEAKTAEAKQAAANHDRAENTELDSVKAELEALERAHEVEDTTQTEQWPAGGGATWQDDAVHSAAEPVTIGNAVQGTHLVMASGEDFLAAHICLETSVGLQALSRLAMSVGM